ncbi:uncharacterized protein LOC126833284 isoform X2 [Adelges cooleyi]|uniref:uncharacterized protein LOC126833284 isoform X2 n=1 Tax=Adelges cooleyi TaxID=133065 RepID=UPI00217F51A2|nr:uncharacterized protein LOC126833284 isoform X2 [Adelges cooleyi]
MKIITRYCWLKMKVFFVLLCCFTLNVVTSTNFPIPRTPTQRTPDICTTANLPDRRRLNATNQFIQIHIDRRTIRNKIMQFVVRQDEDIMKKLTFMFALPEKEINGNFDYQKALEDELQQELSRNLSFYSRFSKSEKELGEDRREMLKPVLKSLITDIRDKHRTNRIDFTHTCRIVGLFWSMRFPDEYTTNADVVGEVCVIRHKELIKISCAFYEDDLCFVNNENHDLTGGSIIPCLN